RTSGEKRVFLVILFTSFSGSLVSRISGAVHMDVPETGTDNFGFTYGKFVCNDSLIGQTLDLPLYFQTPVIT
ncbi:hypothetical protein ACD961_23935, partial [Escherichia coli]